MVPVTNIDECNVWPRVEAYELCILDVFYVVNAAVMAMMELPMHTCQNIVICGEN